MKRIITFFFFASVCASPVLAGWFDPSTYEDCMLEKMKGQNKAMYPTAMRACKKLLHVEEDISPHLVNWDLVDLDAIEDIGGVHADIQDGPSDMEITAGVFEVAAKPCDEAKPDDFRRVTVRFNKLRSAPLPSHPACGRALMFHGVYK